MKKALYFIYKMQALAGLPPNPKLHTDVTATCDICGSNSPYYENWWITNQDKANSYSKNFPKHYCRLCVEHVMPGLEEFDDFFAQSALYFLEGKSG